MAAAWVAQDGRRTGGSARTSGAFPKSVTMDITCASRLTEKRNYGHHVISSLASLAAGSSASYVALATS